MDGKPLVPLRIKQAYTARELDKADLSNIMGVAMSTISRWEQGRENPSQQDIYRLSDILDFPIHFFYKPMPVKICADSPLFICTNIGY